MHKLFIAVAGLMLMLGSVGCEYIYAPMDSKDLADHPLKPLPTDYQAKIWIKLAPSYSHTDLHFSRWDFYAPQPWKEGYLFDKRPAFEYTYQWRCDVNVTFLKPKQKEEKQRYTFVWKDGDAVAEAMEGSSPTQLLTPNSALPYRPYDVVLNQVDTLTAHLPDKTWTVDDQQPNTELPKGVRALYVQKTGQAGYDSSVYLVEKLTHFSGWRYEEDGKMPTVIGETPIYYVLAFKGPGAWPTFEKDVMETLFPATPADPGFRIGERTAAGKSGDRPWSMN